ncbi:MAG: Flp family type IVb pilin [Acidobacteria bacterium]|nr:Flp family type IVb pilin [Acidobacteriota bacterium]
MRLPVLRRLWFDDDGQDLIEYALLAGFVSLASALAVINLGTVISGIFDTIAEELESGEP